jgi:hypothetical protein
MAIWNLCILSDFTKKDHVTLNDGPMIKTETNHFSECLKIKNCVARDSFTVSDKEKVLWCTESLSEFLLHLEPAYDTVHMSENRWV